MITVTANSLSETLRGLGLLLFLDPDPGENVNLFASSLECTFYPAQTPVLSFHTSPRPARPLSLQSSIPRSEGPYGTRCQSEVNVITGPTLRLSSCASLKWLHHRRASIKRIMRA